MDAKIVLAALLAGCTAPPEGESDTGPAGDPALFASIEAAPAPGAQTVVVVTWSTTEPVRGRVEFGEGEDRALTTPLEAAPAAEHRALLLGLPPLADVTFEVVVEGEDGETRSEVHATATGGVPASLPGVETTGEAGLDGGYFAVPALTDTTAGTHAVAILDGDGRYVWAHALGEGETSLRARPAADGSGMVFNVVGLDKDVEIEPALRHVSWEGEVLASVAAPELHHDFVQLPGGAYAYLGTEPRDVGAGMMPSDTIVEVAPDGTTEVVWRLWDHFAAFGGAPAPDQIAEGETLGHANAMQYVADRDAYVVSFAHLGAVALIPRAGGAPAWVLGSPASSLAYDTAEMPTWRGHGVDLLGDSLLMFVNDAGESECSRIWEVTLDEAAGTAARAWAHQAEPCYYNYVLGGVGRLPSGDVLATWSVAGRIDRISRTDGVVWSARTSVGAGFAYGEVLAALYP